MLRSGDSQGLGGDAHLSLVQRGRDEYSQVTWTSP